jgi:hypothetical protein
MPEHSAATDAWNDNPAATPSPPRRIVDGLTRKLRMMLNRSYHLTVLRDCGIASMPNCSTPFGWW